jgi:signal transduction histidine kinase
MPSADDQLVDDVTRIAGSVRAVIGSRAAMVSRVVDDEWLEVMAVAGEPSEGIVEGLRWRRSDLDSLLASAEQLGRLHLTKRRAVTYVEIPDSVPETERYITGHLGLLLAPLRGPSDQLLGVLSTEGPVDIANPAPGVCELVELYAEQARLALGALRDRGQLAERLRMSHAAHVVLQDAAAADDLPGLLDAVAQSLAGMIRAKGAWACAELEPGVHAEGASYPPAVGERLGSDVCTLLEPTIATSMREERAFTHHEDPLLGRLAGVAGLEQALLAPIGDGTGTRGALLVLRGPNDDGWTADEHEAIFVLGRRLGRIADQVRGRRRDQQTLEQLRRLDESRRDLVASITHDLKTPLTAIALNTELLESDGRLAEAGSHPVAAIRRSADRLSNLVDDLLAMARAEEGADRPVEVDLVEMVRDACRHIETEATLRGVTFEMDSPEELRLAVDANALARVLANVVSNAVKFSLPRGRVLVGLTRGDGVIEFRCRDDGIGIPADRLATLFDIARRTPDARVENIPGSGIGLAICARIVARLGGEIDVESTQGEGSTFTVRLPG